MFTAGYLAAFLVLWAAADAQKSFASTNPDLPAEEPIIIAENRDPKRRPGANKPHRKHHGNNKPIEALPSTAPQPPVNAPNPATPTPVVPLRTLAPIAAPGIEAATVAPLTLPTFSPLPGLPTIPTIPPPPPPPPQQPQQPAFGQFGFPGGVSIPRPPLPASPLLRRPPSSRRSCRRVRSAASCPKLPSNHSKVQPQQRQPDLQLVHFTAAPDQTEVSLWFREDYDTSACRPDPRYLAAEFRQKFPVNLWRSGNGKEAILAELLSARLSGCLEKQEGGHWQRVNELLAGLQIPTTEEDECRTGLIQEQIACKNVFSYTCQFIQKEYIFRLVPTRIIIQEARIAEDGAEKCRKVVRKVKKDLQG
ncbi:hypothetical protein M3Y99_01447500 [Aphelenchoides fujianensis]|nr:hypothetical protein M3Y99_01447500 [Aphelenchoides fujianensis]